MAKYVLNQEVFDKCNQAVVISGGARNGTTIVGKFVHSLKDVEYFFEPASINSLFPLINELPEDKWKLLYESGLYEEMLINAVTGRNLNCNLEDDSSIYKVKEREDIEQRQAKSFSKAEAKVAAASKTVAYKHPNIVPYLPKLVSYYPGSKVILMRRNPSDAISSIILKQCFNDEDLLGWPARLYKDKKIPFWVKESDVELWMELNETDRAGYYYIQMMQAYADVENKLIIDYEQLVGQPQEVANKLSEFIQADITEKTKEIVSSIYVRNVGGDKNKLDVLSESMRQQVEAVYQASFS